MASLDRLIPPEIRDDALADVLRRIAANPEVRTILEEGSSSGSGSTDALVRGALENPGGPPDLHCLELSTPRFRELVDRHGHRGFVHCHNVSAVRSARFLGPDEIRGFCAGFRPWLRRRSPGRYMEWLRQDRDYAVASGADGDGIRALKDRLGLEAFDAALLDGSEFAGRAVLEDLEGTGLLVLDDIRSLKNHGNYRRLRRDPDYALVERSWFLRNGYAVFRRHDGPEPVAA